MAPWILAVEDEGAGRGGFQGCALDDRVGWLNNRFVVLLLHVSGNVGRIGSLQWKTRNPTSALLNLNSQGMSRLHHPVGRETQDLRAREKPQIDSMRGGVEPKSG